MKYIVRFIAVIPMMISAINLCVFMALCVESKWYILLVIGSFFCFMRLARDYEVFVLDIMTFLKKMAKGILE